MMFYLSVREVIEIILTIVAIGYLASGIVVGPSYYYDEKEKKNRLLKAMLIVSPAIILHEFGHKIVAGLFGNYAEYHMHWFGMALGIIAKQIGFPIIFVPAYISIGYVNYSAMSHLIISLSGPAVNLILFLAMHLILKIKGEQLEGDWYYNLFMMKKVNMWLFLFNLIPLPGTDGMQALTALSRLI